MKKLIVLILLFFPLCVYGHDITLEWDYPDPPTDIEGFRLYTSTVSGSYSSHAVEISWPKLQGKVVIPSDGTHYFVATAYDESGNESDFSNEVSVTLVTGVPGKPQMLKIIIIQESSK